MTIHSPVTPMPLWRVIDLIQPKPQCATMRILKSRYHANFRVYMEAVHSIEDAIGTVIFNEKYERVKRSQEAFELSKVQLNRHCQKHGCGE